MISESFRVSLGNGAFRRAVEGSFLIQVDKLELEVAEFAILVKLPFLLNIYLAKSHQRTPNAQSKKQSTRRSGVWWHFYEGSETGLVPRNRDHPRTSKICSWTPHTKKKSRN
jgi:hypothetical protein